MKCHDKSLTDMVQSLANSLAPYQNNANNLMNLMNEQPTLTSTLETHLIQTHHENYELVSEHEFFENFLRII